MNDPNALSTLVSTSLAGHTERVRQKVHALVAPLDREQLWQPLSGWMSPMETRSTPITLRVVALCQPS